MVTWDREKSSVGTCGSKEATWVSSEEEEEGNYGVPLPTSGRRDLLVREKTERTGVPSHVVLGSV